MSNVGKAIIVLGLIGIEGAIYTGSGWFTSSVLIIIGCTLWICGNVREKKKGSARLWTIRRTTKHM